MFRTIGSGSYLLLGNYHLESSRHVGTVEACGTTWDLHEEVYCSGGGFPNHQYELRVIEHWDYSKDPEVKDLFLLRSVDLCMLLPFEDFKSLLEHQGKSVESEVRRTLSDRYHSGILRGN